MLPLDAAKRRALPAWIREGLEKMEREKQKKAEQERLAKLKKEEAIDEPQAPASSDAVPSNGADLVGPLRKSRFVSMNQLKLSTDYGCLTKPGSSPYLSHPPWRPQF